MPAFSLTVLVRAVAVWLLMMAAESAQGALRRWLLGPDPVLLVRQGAVLVSIVLIFVIAWVSRRWLAPRSDAGALAVGVLWAALTVGFELALGAALGLDRARILADYDLGRGGLMPLGLLAMALTPWAVRRLQRPAA